MKATHPYTSVGRWEIQNDMTLKEMELNVEPLAGADVMHMKPSGAELANDARLHYEHILCMIHLWLV